MNVIDKAVEYLNPLAAVRRHQARLALDVLRKLDVQNAGYSESGASRSKASMEGFTDVSRDPRNDIGANLTILRQRSRSLYQNEPVARGAIDRLRVWGIGPGLHVTPEPNAAVLGLSREEERSKVAEIKARWHAWASSERCDAYGMLDIYTQQRLALSSWMQSGDVFATLPVVGDELRVRLIEADYCITPGDRQGVEWQQRFVNGVELDATGRVDAYWFAKRHPLEMNYQEAQAMTRVPLRGAASGRRNVLQVFEPERPGYFRGVPYLAPVIEAFRQLQQYTRAEIAAALTSAIFTGVIYTETPNIPLGESDPPLGASSDNDGSIADDGSYQKPMLGSGNILQLTPGERMEMLASNRPNSNFGSFTEANARQIGAGINTPLDVLLLKYDSSYTASRAHNMAFVKWVMLVREILVRRYGQPIYEEWLTLEVLLGRIDLPGFLDDPFMRAAWLRAVWYGPAMGVLDPYKEAQAVKTLLEQRLTTRAQTTMEMFGREWDGIADDLEDEEQRLRDGNLAAAPPATPPSAEGA